MLGKVVTSVDVTFTFQMTEEEFTATLTPVSSSLRATKFTFQATGYPEGQYIVKFVETGQTEVLATVAGFVSGNPIFATSQYNTYNDDGTSTTYVPSDDQGLVPSVSQKLRVSTIDQATDVSYVRYLKVTNGTLTDNRDNSVTLDTGAGTTSLADLSDTQVSNASPGTILSWNGAYWIPIAQSTPPNNTDGLPEGDTNLYYTEARVAASPTVAANTAKVGITAQQASDITTNNSKVGITTAQADAIVANTAKVGITTQQASDITANNAKVGITTSQATEIALNTNKTSYPSADATKLAGIEASADVTDAANVEAAGALMDSEVTNLAQVKAFNSSDYATAAQGSTADSALQDVVDDTTPQLGGNLDVNGQDIVTTSNGNINLNPNGTGQVVFKGNATRGAGQFTLNCEDNSHGIIVKSPPHSAGASYTLTLPDDTGTNGQALTTDGSGNLSFTTVPSAIGDLSDVPSSLGTSGQVLAVNSGGTALEYVAQSGGGGGSTVSLKGKFIIWAEENGGLNSSQGNGYQWSFGNGDEADVGLALPFDCTATQMIFNCVQRGTSGTVNLHKGTSTVQTTSSSVESISFGSVYSATTTFSTPVSFSAGEWMTFRTTAQSGGWNDCRVGVVFEYDIADLTAYQGATGAQGASGTSYDVTTLTASTTLSSLHTTKYLVCNSTSSIGLTVPASASYDTYAEFVIEQRGTGQVTVVADSGVTIHSTETLKSGAQYAVMGLKRTDTNTYVLTGEREQAP